MVLFIKMASKPSVAKQRWQILGDALKTKTVSSASNSVSVRRFDNFGLFKSVKTNEVYDNVDWYEYTCDEFKNLRLAIRHVSNSVKTDQLIGFNNTGNVCIWPAEEVLAYYSLKNADIFKGKNVCELGGGMTCLAGLMISVHSEAKKVLLTDGNPNSIENVELIVKRNEEKFDETCVTFRLLNWNDLNSVKEYESGFDILICADCLFFKEMVDSLIETIYFLLKSDGFALILAPSRNETFQFFVDKLDTKFTEKLESYDDRIFNLHNENKLHNPAYSEDLHYPLMLKMYKPDNKK